MLSAGRANQQARQIWIALGCYGHVDTALLCSGVVSSVASGAATIGSEARGIGPAGAHSTDHFKSQTACSSGRAEPIICGSHGPTGDAFDRIRAGAPSAVLPCHRPPILLGAPNVGGTWLVQPLTTATLGAGGQLPLGWAMPAAAALAPLGRRCYHPWYYGSKLRNRTILSISSLDHLGELLRQSGDEMDHVNLVVFLRQVQLLAANAADKAAAASAAADSTAPTTDQALDRSATAAAAASYDTAGAGAGSGSRSVMVASAVAAAASRAVEMQVQLLAEEAARLVGRRSKWYDPRNAAAVVAATAALRHTDGRLLHELTGRTLNRLNEAYSRDLLLLLRGLIQHARMSRAAAASASAAASAGTSQPQPQLEADEPLDRAPIQGQRQGAVAKPWWQRRRRRPYGGAPPELLEGVERFLLAKIPTGRMPPENVDGLLRCLRELSPIDGDRSRPLARELLASAEEDLRRRLAIYAPGPLAGLLSSLAAERHPLPPDLLDAAAQQFAAHADTYGTGAAAARFLSAAVALLLGRKQAVAADDGTTVSGGGGAFGGGVVPSPGEWVAARPKLLAQCLRSMSKDVSGAGSERLAAWMGVLHRAEVPLASLAVASATAAAAPSGPAAAAASVAAAAAAFVRAHGATVEGLAAAARIPTGWAAQLRKAYDDAGLSYPKGL